MFTAFYIPHIILIESKQRLYPTKWKTRFASCLDGPCLKLYAISVDQHNCQQMDSTFVAVADFPYFCHSLKSVEATKPIQMGRHQIFEGLGYQCLANQV